MAGLKIDEVARLVGIHPGSLRRLDLQGKLGFQVQRDPKGDRIFTLEDVEAIRSAIRQGARRGRKRPGEKP